MAVGLRLFAKHFEENPAVDKVRFENEYGGCLVSKAFERLAPRRLDVRSEDPSMLARERLQIKLLPVFVMSRK